MKNTRFWAYSRLFIALPLLSGLALMIFAFVPLTDDFGNEIFQSAISRAFIFGLGFVMTVAAFLVAVPELISKRRKSRV